MMLLFLSAVLSLSVYLAYLIKENAMKIEMLEDLVKNMHRYLLEAEQKRQKKDPEEYKKEEAKIVRRLTMRKIRKKKRAVKDPVKEFTALREKPQAEAASG